MVKAKNEVGEIDTPAPWVLAADGQTIAPAPLDTAPCPTRRQCIGFLADFTYSEYTARLFSGVLDAAESQGLTVQRFRLSGSGDNEETFRRCIAEDLAGVIVHDPDFRIPAHHLAAELRGHGLPYVLLDVRGFEDVLPGVSSADEDGMREAVFHLAELGHKRILFCAGVQGVGSAIARLPGYENAMRDCGLERYIEVLWTHWEESRRDDLIRKSFMNPVRPTAYICGSDATALGVIKNFHEMGIKVPRDVSVVGFGNLLRTEYASPPLTTVAVAYEQMGRAAVKMVLDERGRVQEDGPHSGWKLVPTQLMMRRSTSRPLY